MKTAEIFRGWKTILAGRTPFLSIEITKECPLRCPGCYAYGDDHISGILLNQISDYKGQELVDRFMGLVDRYQPLHISIVGGVPLVRFRELNEILPQLVARTNPYPARNQRRSTDPNRVVETRSHDDCRFDRRARARA